MKDQNLQEELQKQNNKRIQRQPKYIIKMEHAERKTCDVGERDNPQLGKKGTNGWQKIF